MTRLAVVLLSLALLAAPLAAEAQPPGKAPPCIGYLGIAGPKTANESLDAFRQGSS